MPPITRPRFPTLVLCCAGVAAVSSPRVHADEAAIVRDIEAFISTDDADERAKIAARIAEDPDYSRDRVSAWLHNAKLFEPQDAGTNTLRVSLPNGEPRDVVVRIPSNYDPARPMALIYALHGQGGQASQITTYFERILGPRVDEFIIAAPDQYDEVVIHHTRWPPTQEHPAMLLALRKKFHIDADRTFVAGYSRGGHTSWTLAALHADQWAGAMPLAGTFLMAEIDRLWDPLLDNLAHTHLLCVWGENDTLDDSGSASAEGGIAGLNRQLRDLCAKRGDLVTMIELPGIGHGGVRPPAEALESLLSQRREHYPSTIRHTFRHAYHASAYWIEAHTWAGEQWAEKLPSVGFRTGEDAADPQVVREAMTRAIRGVLGEISGEAKGQELRIKRKHISDLTVWLSDELIDFAKPVTIYANGRKIFDERIEPELAVCLSQAARTYDFDRLRWAGVRYKSGSRARPVTIETPFQ